MTTTKFYNNKFNIILNDIIRGGDNSVVVTRNIPFTIVVENIDVSLTKDKISLKLVYENDYRPVTTISQSSSPIEYKIHLSGNTVTIETRILALSSKHENNRFRVIMLLDGKPIQTELIRCVSKITNSVINNKEIGHHNKDTNNNSNNINNNNTSTTTNNNNNSDNKNNNEGESNKNHVQVKKSKPTTINTHLNNNKHDSLSNTIKKLKFLRKKDKNLITLLYQQNKLITQQLNQVTTVVNSLVEFHNQYKTNHQQQQQQQQQQLQLQSSPSSLYEAPASSPSTPYYESSPSYINNNSDINNMIVPEQQQSPSQQEELQFPIIDQEILKSVQVNESCFSYTSDCSSQLSDYGSQQPMVGSDVMLMNSSCSSLLGSVVVNTDSGSIRQDCSSFKNNDEVRQQYQQINTNNSNCIINNNNNESTYSQNSLFNFGLDFNFLDSQNCNQVI